MRAICLVLLSLSLALIGAPSAEASIGCGASVTHSIKLTHDIKNCSSTGLNINADNVVVNLNGHMITGQAGNPDSGVRSALRDGTVVKNGTIKLFQIGVELDFGTGDVVSGVTAHNNGTGVDLCHSNDSDVHGNHISGGLFGVSIDCGPATGNVVRGNTISGTANSGLELDNVAFNSIRSNKMTNAGTGVNVIDGAHDNTIGGNQVVNSSDGVIVASTSASNLFTNNVLKTNSNSGILVEGAGSDNNKLEGNRTNGNGSNGILVGSDPTGTTIDGNTANGNQADGLDIEASDPATTVANNVANNNVGFGIFAIVGVTDGGGNSASGNGAGNCSMAITC